MPGRFITIEGIEGVGKTTQARLLARALERAGSAVCLTREPGGTPEAEALRTLLLRGSFDWSPRAEALLHFAARAEHVDRVIAPALARGEWVISDRYSDSTMAYQGYGQGSDRSFIGGLRRLLALDPDLTIILDLPLEVARTRLAGRGLPLFERAEGPGSTAEKDRYEALGQDFFARVREGFREIATAEPERCLILDSTGAIPAVHEQILAAVLEHFMVAPAQ